VFDYDGWVRRAATFVTGLPTQLEGDIRVSASVSTPFLSSSEVRSLEFNLNRSVPAELCALFEIGSGECNCRYVWNPENDAEPLMKSIFGYQDYIYGGPRFYSSLISKDGMESCLEVAEALFEDAPGEKSLWSNALPFTPIDNGDYLALDLSGSRDGPPVIYLSHEGESEIIAPDFVTFLQTWERLCYIGPEIWLLAEFIDESGLLNADTEKARQLRKLFRIKTDL